MFEIGHAVIVVKVVKKIIKSEKLMSKLKIMNPLHKLNTEMHLNGEYELTMNLGKDKTKQEALVY